MIDFILGVGVAVILLAALIAWSAWIHRLDRKTFAEAFDARMNALQDERGPLCYARNPVGPGFTCTRRCHHFGPHAWVGHETAPNAVWSE